ncbi:hypothetical protein LOTGIDRAFT_229778 [Lottia gigantea]|uniref:Peptidase S1 domain-containing protein n=1 Tax=Lottia gigantea TaxID=225164 RepID=V3YXE1_LOTGI|nr:hypothetical protein LOTGIDRAFT_229778 [Lottia gigantea]ESO82743.1 hypothetical protein LOTGIDRAFT_229778 [Lottia gigantea]
MKLIVKLLAVCVLSEIQCLELCSLINPKGLCKLSADCDGEIENYGSYVCPDPTVCCIAPDTTTPEPTTEPPSTEPPTTTEEPTTIPSTTVLPVTEQCGVRPENDLMFRLLGGTVKEIQSWPWMVSIRGKSTTGDTATKITEDPTQENTTPVCAGVFIHEQYVATTGFCILKLYAAFKSAGFTFDPLKNILLKSGETTTNSQDFVGGFSTEQQFKVIEIIPHTDFVIQDFENDAYNFSNLIRNPDTFLPNNLALLKLEQPVVFNGNVRKCCAPNLTESACSIKKSGCIIAGWGDSSENGVKNDGAFREIEVEVFSKEVVDAAAQFTSSLATPLQSVAKFTAAPGNVCDGDNGGMVVCQNDEDRWALEGLVSIGDVSVGCTPLDSFKIVDIKAAWPWIEKVERGTIDDDKAVACLVDDDEAVACLADDDGAVTGFVDDDGAVTGLVDDD